MALFRSSHKLNHLHASLSARQCQSLSTVFRHYPRHLSTHNEQPPPPQQSQDSFLRPPQGEVYGRLLGINENTLKTDIITMLEGCNLTPDDIKVDYNRVFYPVAMLLRFPSMSEYTAAFREIAKKGRLVRLDKVEHKEWDIIMPCNGCYVLLQGIPRNALMDDVERFLSGCNYESSSFEMFVRGGYSSPIKMAKVRFPSTMEAMNAVIQKNGNFCLNSRIITRLIQ